MKIQVTKKNQYGVERVFPVDDNAETFSKFTGRKTFSPEDLETIRKLGFEVEYVHAPSASG